jgi:hypothetical protein
MKSKDKPMKTKQFQLSETEFLKVQLEEQKLQNLQMQSLSVQNNIMELLKVFCKRISQKFENILVDNMGRMFIDKDGKVTFKEE